MIRGALERGGLALAVVLGLASPSSAQAPAPLPSPLPGAFLFARFGSIYQQPGDLGQPPVAVGELPDDAAEVKSMEAIRDGKLVVVNLVDYPVWIYAPDPKQPALLRGGPCTGRARPNPWGGCLVCPTREGPMLVAAGRTDQAPLAPASLGPLDEAAFLGDSGTEMGARTPDGIVAFDRRKPEERRMVAKPGARSHLLFSPDGKKAVAIFGEGDAGRIRSFLLDGEGVSRQLGGPGIPRTWSWDSTWVLFDEGDIKDTGDQSDEGEAMAPAADAADPFLLAAPRRKKPPPRRRHKPKGKIKAAPAAPAESGPLIRACVARVTGGEVKCWNGYLGMAFSPDSTLVLLKRDKSLYVGRIAGVRPEPPHKIIDEVDGAATWVPGPIATGTCESAPGTDTP